MEEPYDPEYPKDPEFHARFGPCNIIDTKATDVDDPTEHPRWGRVGKQTIADGGPLPPHPDMDAAASVNMEDVDAELVRRSLDFIDRSVAADTPFFLWHNSTRCHVWTHLAPKWQCKSGFGLYADAMMELDWEVGEILNRLDELGIADNFIVLFTSDNGAEIFTWPDGGNQPFRGEKGSTYEGGFRVPMVAKWPGVIEPGTIVNEIMAHEDWLPTLLAAAGQPGVTEKLLTGETLCDPRPSMVRSRLSRRWRCGPARAAQLRGHSSSTKVPIATSPPRFGRRPRCLASASRLVQGLCLGISWAPSSFGRQRLTQQQRQLSRGFLLVEPPLSSPCIWRSRWGIGSATTPPCRLPSSATCPKFTICSYCSLPRT